MWIMVPVEERMLTEAEFGFFELCYLITTEKADELRKDGFSVTSIEDREDSPRVFRIDWSRAGESFKDEDVLKLNENDPKYKLSEKLFIISTQSNAVSL